MAAYVTAFEAQYGRELQYKKDVCEGARALHGITAVWPRGVLCHVHESRQKKVPPPVLTPELACLFFSSGQYDLKRLTQPRAAWLQPSATPGAGVALDYLRLIRDTVCTGFFGPTDSCVWLFWYPNDKGQRDALGRPAEHQLVPISVLKPMTTALLAANPEQLGSSTDARRALVQRYGSSELPTTRPFPFVVDGETYRVCLDTRAVLEMHRHLRSNEKRTQRRRVVSAADDSDAAEPENDPGTVMAEGAIEATPPPPQPAAKRARLERPPVLTLEALQTAFPGLIHVYATTDPGEQQLHVPPDSMQRADRSLHDFRAVDEPNLVFLPMFGGEALLRTRTQLGKLELLADAETELFGQPRQAQPTARMHEALEQAVLLRRWPVLYERLALWAALEELNLKPSSPAAGAGDFATVLEFARYRHWLQEGATADIVGAALLTRLHALGAALPAKSSLSSVIASGRRDWAITWLLGMAERFAAPKRDGDVLVWPLVLPTETGSSTERVWLALRTQPSDWAGLATAAERNQLPEMTTLEGEIYGNVGLVFALYRECAFRLSTELHTLPPPAAAAATDDDTVPAPSKKRARKSAPAAKHTDEAYDPPPPPASSKKHPRKKTAAAAAPADVHDAVPDAAPVAMLLPVGETSGPLELGDGRLLARTHLLARLFRHLARLDVSALYLLLHATDPELVALYRKTDTAVMLRLMPTQSLAAASTHLSAVWDNTDVLRGYKAQVDFAAALDFLTFFLMDADVVASAQLAEQMPLFLAEAFDRVDDQLAAGYAQQRRLDPHLNVWDITAQSVQRILSTPALQQQQAAGAGIFKFKKNSSSSNGAAAATSPANSPSLPPAAARQPLAWPLDVAGDVFLVTLLRLLTSLPDEPPPWKMAFMKAHADTLFSVRTPPTAMAVLGVVDAYAQEMIKGPNGDVIGHAFATVGVQRLVVALCHVAQACVGAASHHADGWDLVDMATAMHLV